MSPGSHWTERWAAMRFVKGLLVNLKCAGPSNYSNGPSCLIQKFQRKLYLTQAMPGHNFLRDVWERFRSDNESWLAGPSIKCCLCAPSSLMSYGHPGSYSKTRQPSVTSVGKSTLQVCRWIQNKWAFHVCLSYSIYNMRAFLQRSWNAFQVCLI